MAARAATRAIETLLITTMMNFEKLTMDGVRSEGEVEVRE